MASHHSSEMEPVPGINIQTGSSLFNDVDEKAVRVNDLDNYILIDSFNEDEVEHKLLKSKPTCFLIIGKPGVGKTTLAKKLSENFKSELVSSTDLINENIAKQNQLGKMAQDILVKGGAVPEDIVARMIDEKIKSPEVEHHGYVLDGFPCQSDSNFDISRQVEMLKNWKLQPDFIINLRISDKDLVNRRTAQKIDPVLGKVYIKEVYAPEVKNKSKKAKIKEEEEEEAEEEGEEEEEDIPEEPLDEFFTPLAAELVNTLVVRPEDTLPMVNDSILSFKEALLHILEDQMANMDQSYLMEVDSNLSPTVILRQLLMRLDSYPIRKAFRPMRMTDPITVEAGEEEAGAGDTPFIDNAEVEESMNGLETKKKLSAKFKWRRSKCSFYCPVSLKNGKTVAGRADFAAAFLDKIYLMANEEALKEFLTNPRPYLLPPQPRAPCKIAIMGNSFAGKTSLASLLARKYNAKVIQMDELIKDEMQKSRDVVIEKAKKNAVEDTKELIKNKFKEKLESEKAKKELELAAKMMEAEGAGEEGANEDGGLAEVPEEQAETPKIPSELPESEVNDLASESEKSVYMGEDGEIVVDNEHPEILEAVQKAADFASTQKISLPPSVYISVLSAELENIRKERIQQDPTAIGNAGWILDNFPQTSDQLNAMLENNLLPDSFFFLQETSEELGIISRRWFNANRESIEDKAYKRLVNNSSSKEQKPQTETAEAASKPAEAAAESDEPGNRDILEKIVEEDEPNVTAEKKASNVGSENNSVAAATRSENSTIFRQPLPELKLGEVPPRNPETIEFLNNIRLENESIKSIQNSIISITGNESSIIEINYNAETSTVGKHVPKPVEELCAEVHTIVEKNYKFVAVEFDGGAEEEMGEEAEEGEEEEEEEEVDDGEEMEEEDEDETFDPSVKDKKTKFGETSHYCPVSFITNGILVPGNAELQAKYRDRVYRFSSEEARNAFMEDPEIYLPKKGQMFKAPAPRLIIVGPRGSGKSTQARLLAEKLDLFHVKFRDYLQELIIGKSKKYLEPEREEDREDEEEEEENDEEDPNEPKPEKEEIVLPEYTEKEELIRGYLERDEPLPSDIIDSVLGQLWTDEPFKSRGFVLDGFPNNESETSYLIEKGYLPDAVIILRVDEEQIIKRLLPPRLSKWQTRMAAKKEKKRLKALKKKEKLNKRMKERRDEEIAKYEEEKRKKEAELEASGETADDEEEEPFDVEELIREEFADELGEEEMIDDVNEDEIKENMITDIRNNYENQMSLIDLAKEPMTEAQLPRFKIDGNRRIKIVEYLLRKKLVRFVENRDSLFERVYTVKLKTAQKLLDFGYKQLSRFSRWCPVKLMQKQPVPPYFGEEKKPLTVIHRSFIYFLSSKEAKRKFCENPIQFLRQPSPLPVVPFRLSVIGPPKSGKSSLANRFTKEFGCVRLSVGEAIRAVLDKQPNTALAQEIRQYLFKGKTVPDELAIQCLEIGILDVKCQLRGYVLDGFPSTKQQVKLMTDRGLIPVKVIEIKCDIKEIMLRCIKDRTQPERLTKSLILNDSPEVIGYKLREWKKEIGFIRDWYSKEHKNLVQLDGVESKWSLWEKSKLVAFESIVLIQNYLNRVGNLKAASIAKLCVTYDEMKARLGDFGQYCPVSLALRGELVDCSEFREMDFVAEFQGYYYKMFSQTELDIFLNNPQDFVAPKAPRRLPAPHLLPRKVSPAEVKKLFPKGVIKAELNGYCAVTFYDGKERYEAICQGKIEHAVEYMGKVFYMTDNETMEKFMKKPEIYGKLKLPHKLPPVAKKMDVFSLPMTGFLEQTVSELVKKSLNEVGNYKPKFPFLSPTRSSLLYVAYYLKAFNPRASEYRRKKYKQKLMFFEEKCELIDFLYSQTTLRYKEPTKRSIEYNSKFESFFALQDNAPTMNWLS